MRVLVTGGAGYVGSHCARALLDAGHAVTVLDNLSVGHRAAVDPRATFIEGDLADADALGRLLGGGCDGVLHFAASALVGESVAEPLRYYRNNVANTLQLLEAMKAGGVRRMVFSSTCATYGAPARLPITEDLPQHPLSPYGASKLAVEWMMRDSGPAWGLGSMALRYFNASGAARSGEIGEDHKPETHLIPLVLQVALGQRQAIKVFGTDYDTPDGTCVRDYIHVEDLARAHVAAIEQLEPGHFEAYNVGTGRGSSVREIIEACRAVTRHPIPAIETGRRPGDPPALYADPTAIRKRLGWTAEITDVAETIADAWRWHQAHPSGFRDG